MASADAMLSKTAKEIRKFHGDALKKHGGGLRKKLVASGKVATGGDGALSGLGNTPKLGVSVRTTGGSRVTHVRIKPSPKAATGPWVWMDSGTKAGMRAKRKSVRADGDTRSGTSATYRHPGTKGKNAWSSVRDPELPKIRKKLEAEFNAITR